METKVLDRQDIDVDAPLQTLGAMEVALGPAEPMRDVRPTRVTVEARPVARPEPPPPADPMAFACRFSADESKHPALFAALAKAQGEFGDVERTLKAKINSSRANYEYRYAPLDEVLEAIRPAMSQNGLVVMQFPNFNRKANEVTVRTMVAHESGAWMSNDLTLVVIDGAPQTVAGGITYARRYGLQPVVGVAPDTDTDGAPAAPLPPPMRPAQRVSETNKVAEASASPDAPSPVGKIVEVVEQGNALKFRLDTGFKGAATDPEVQAAVRSFAKVENAQVQVGYTPSRDASKYLPVVHEVTLKVR